MNPVSISASVLTFIHAASAVTLSVRGFVESIKYASTKLSDLDHELSRLSGHLTSIDGAMAQCKRTNALLSAVTDDIWYKSLAAAKDCNDSLNELEDLVARIKRGMEAPRLWRSVPSCIFG
ncbi:hypothetical protein QBC38DRAFT_38456 [Podospora fimiseda]|uniref:Fungal N-terminal domain-containing protein n=1 Tax=Podospora fimiseda TaxID=252190 RepID=A0AAN7BI99_9PEZI|nr:hypothetical protein QBC38DRAFT_38456 [Podospora fimiseda]